MEESVIDQAFSGTSLCFFCVCRCLRGSEGVFVGTDHTVGSFPARGIRACPSGHPDEDLVSVETIRLSLNEK